MNNCLPKLPAGQQSNSPGPIGNMQQQQYGSSRESSPDYSNSNSKIASRDSSPGLNYRKSLLFLVVKTYGM